MSGSDDGPVKFSRDEIKQIRNMLGTPTSRVACPLCNGILTVSNPVDGPHGPCFFVGCKPCERKAVVTDVPGLWQPGPRG